MKIVFDTTDQRIAIAYEHFKENGKKVVKYSENLIENGDICVFSPAKKWGKDEISRLHTDITIIAGAINDEQKVLLDSMRIKYINLLDDEAFAIQNANLTAEGVLAILLQETDRSMYEHRILIVGVGRIGKALAILFGRLGLDFTLGSFSDKDKIQGNFYLCPCEPKGEFLNHLKKYDVIINTIPNVVFDENNLERISQDAIVIETASKNCIEDVNNLAFRYILAPKLPQKYCLRTASSLVISKIEEVLDD